MGRPIGSYTGIKPEGGYPDVSTEDGWFLAGFLDGEACFSIIRHPGPRYSCVCATSARRDDEGLLTDLRDLTNIGRISRSNAQGRANPLSTWTVGRKADCERLSQLIEDFPLQSRKHRDAGTWRLGVQFWTEGGVGKLHRSRDWTGLAFLADKIKEDRAYVLRLGFEAQEPPTPEVRAYLSGFLTAEGHLGIFKQTGGKFGVRCVIAMRGDDLPLLQELHSAFKIGRIRLDERPGANPTAIWAIHSAQHLRTLVEILDEHPPRGRKLAEYGVWRKAALLGADRDAYERLREIRAFSEPKARPA